MMARCPVASVQEVGVVEAILEGVVAQGHDVLQDVMSDIIHIVNRERYERRGAIIANDEAFAHSSIATELVKSDICLRRGAKDLLIISTRILLVRDERSLHREMQCFGDDRLERSVLRLLFVDTPCHQGCDGRCQMHVHPIAHSGGSRCRHRLFLQIESMGIGLVGCGRVPRPRKGISIRAATSD